MALPTYMILSRPDLNKYTPGVRGMLLRSMSILYGINKRRQRESQRKGRGGKLYGSCVMEKIKNFFTPAKFILWVRQKIFEKYTPKYTVEIFNKYLGL